MKKPIIDIAIGGCKEEYVNKCQLQYEKYIEVCENKIKKLEKENEKVSKALKELAKSYIVFKECDGYCKDCTNPCEEENE